MAAMLINFFSYAHEKHSITKTNYMKHFKTSHFTLTACYFIMLFAYCIAMDSCITINTGKCCTDNCVDITNAVLTKRSPHCKDYVGKYCAVVRDIDNDTTFKAGFSIKHLGNKCVWYTDALPNHNFNDNPTDSFPNRVKAQVYRFEIPDNPVFAASKTPLSLDYYNAILLNGALVDLLSDGCCCPPPPPGSLPGTPIPGCGEIIGCSDTSNPWRKDPMSPLAGFHPDSHNAHSQADGTYHYHGDPRALYDTTGATESPLIGFAADGFPIYGPYINDLGTIRKVKSGYKRIGGNRPADSCPAGTYDGTFIQDYEYKPDVGDDLDECNGMWRNGHYGYYLTDIYPYMIRYFRGTPDPSFKKY